MSIEIYHQETNQDDIVEINLPAIQRKKYVVVLETIRNICRQCPSSPNCRSLTVPSSSRKIITHGQKPSLGDHNLCGLMKTPIAL